MTTYGDFSFACQKVMIQIIKYLNEKYPGLYFAQKLLKMKGIEKLTKKQIETLTFNCLVVCCRCLPSD